MYSVSIHSLQYTLWRVPVGSFSEMDDFIQLSVGDNAYSSSILDGDCVFLDVIVQSFF